MVENEMSVAKSITDAAGKLDDLEAQIIKGKESYNSQLDLVRNLESPLMDKFDQLRA
ncbi:hypothetical protein H5W18_06530 [Lactobacillus sp. Marseille-P7033]|nr:hypothetical protein [Lactobacillus sp. Marseille-P7033]NGC78324.1 hypothetical protein [Limosilactobacillus reuteri]